MVNTAVTLLIVGLFLVTGGLLAVGLRSFGVNGSGAAAEHIVGRQVNRQREVLWTGLATLLLLIAFVYVR